LYFLFRWNKEPNQEGVGGGDNERFSAKQWLTLCGIVATAVLAFFQVNVGLAAFAVSVFLTFFRAADEGKVMKKIPWNTLMMITGVGILIELVSSLGGIDLLSHWLSNMMGERTATGIIAILAGVMSWFSSASGVVMPTLIPTVPEIAQTLGGDMNLSLTVALCVGAHLAALSPLSSCGGLMLSAYSSTGEVSEKEKNSTFLKLFGLSACGILFSALLAFLGVY
jgi:di/tricarboxylate transporter